MSILRWSLLGLVLVAALPVSRGQACGPSGDDGFALGCCQIPTPSLPTPPTITMNASWGVLGNCALGFTTTCQVTLGAPTYFQCDYAIINVAISGLGGTPAVSGFLLAKYSRTWQEIATSGAGQNVWRFLVNGDLLFTPTTSCPAGTCLPPCTGGPWFKPAHMVGHIDYTCDPTSSGNTWRAAVSLSHLPGCFQHAFFSTCPIPALAASNTSYHLVGPAPFSFAPPAEPQGGLVGDAIRASTLFFSPFFYFCHGETDLMTGGSLTTTLANCFCTALANGRWRHQNLSVNALCSGFATQLQSIPVGGTPLAPTGFAALRLGQWASGTTFPGNRSLVVYVGVLTNNWSCSPVLSPIQVVTGVGTTSNTAGQLFTIPGAPPVFATSFMDLQNMLPLVTAGPGVPPPGLGSLFASDLVLGLNTP